MAGALHFDRLKYVILDWNYRDAKERRLLDIDEVSLELADVEMIQSRNKIYSIIVIDW